MKRVKWFLPHNKNKKKFDYFDIKFYLFKYIYVNCKEFKEYSR